MKTKKHKLICPSCGITAITLDENAQFDCNKCKVAMEDAPNSKADFEQLLASAYDKIHDLNQQILQLQQDKHELLRELGKIEPPLAEPIAVNEDVLAKF
jgi:hypothetical protein